MARPPPSVSRKHHCIDDYKSEKGKPPGVHVQIPVQISDGEHVPMPIQSFNRLFSS